jgi:hypothetical protein
LTVTALEAPGTGSAAQSPTSNVIADPDGYPIELIERSGD